MALRQTKKISELPALSPASLDTTFVVGISGSTTYKISINNLTSSLDTTFATDLVTNALSNTLDTKLSTSSFNSYTASAINGTISGSSQLTSSFDQRYVISGSITQTTWDNIASKPVGIVSSSTQISDLGFVTGSYTTINSFNSLTQSFNSISQSFNVISGSVGTIDFSTLATTGSNTFIGNQTINGALEISQSIHNWEFGTDGILKLNNGYGEIYADVDSGSVRIGTAAENVAPNAQIILGGFNEIFKIKSGPPLREWTFEGNGDFNLSGSIVGASNLATTGSNTFIGNQTISGSTSISGGLTITNNGYSWSFESNGRTKIPNIIFNSDRGTGMVGIKPVVGREFQIETSTAESSAGPWVFGLDGTLSAPNGANILRVGNLVTTASFNSFTQSYYSASSSFDSRFNGLVTTGSNTFSGSQIFSGSMVVTSGQIIASAITNNSSSLFLQSGSNLYVQNNGLVEITGSLNATSITGSIAATNGVISGSTQLTTAFPSKTTGAWSVPAGASTQSFTVEAGASYTMWVNGNIPNGIITWNATVTTSNTNVPVVGSQYGWYYTAGNALVLTAMPDQIIGTTNTLISSPTSYAPNTSNVFKFGITNNSGTTQTINYGYIKLS
jgi:hypothetical protein